jgi:Domain of unknown function (DUF4157)
MNTHTFKTQQDSKRAAAHRFEDKSTSRSAANLSTGMKSQAVVQGKLEEGELLQGKFQTIQRKGGGWEEEELLQGKFEPIQPKKNTTGLPDSLKSGVENLSGISMDDVQVHYNSDKPSQLQAHAYAQGTDIHIAPGQEKHLPHEAWHVVQQKQGRVQPTMQMMGKVNVNDDAGLEMEADVMGAKAMHRSTPNTAINQLSSINKVVIQREWVGDEFPKHWDVIIDDVQWYIDKQGFIWYDSSKLPAEHLFHKYAGESNKRKPEEWDILETQLQGEKEQINFLPTPQQQLEDEDQPSIPTDIENLKKIINQNKANLEGKIESTRGNSGYEPPNPLKLREVISNWLLEILEEAGWLKSEREIVSNYPGEVIEELNNVINIVLRHYGAETEENDEAETEENDGQTLDFDSILEASLRFEAKSKMLLGQVKYFNLAKEEIGKFDADLEARKIISTDRFVQSEESDGNAKSLAKEYIDKLKEIKTKLTSLEKLVLKDPVFFDNVLKIKPEKILNKYRLTASIDNNLTPKLVAEILNMLKGHYTENKDLSGKLQKNIDAAKAAVGKVITELLKNDQDAGFKIGITGGRKGDTDSGVTKRTGSGEVSHILIHVGEVKEKLKKNAALLGIDVPALAEYGTLFHELSHAVDHDNKKIDGIGALDGGHAKASDVYHKEHTEGWFYDPDFIAAMILEGLDRV